MFLPRTLYKNNLHNFSLGVLILKYCNVFLYFNCLFRKKRHYFVYLFSEKPLFSSIVLIFLKITSLNLFLIILEKMLSLRLFLSCSYFLAKFEPRVLIKLFLQKKKRVVSKVLFLKTRTGKTKLNTFKAFA